jgi:O6-methylguanine-DNA--protein-cysteine methyltransferase
MVAADGSLGGFSAEQGVALKRWLLDLEAAKRASSHGPAMTP